MKHSFEINVTGENEIEYIERALEDQRVVALIKIIGLFHGVPPDDLGKIMEIASACCAKGLDVKDILKNTEDHP